MKRSEAAQGMAAKNKLWSLNDHDMRSLDALNNKNPDLGLRSNESEVLGNDRYRDPHTDRNHLQGVQEK